MISRIAISTKFSIQPYHRKLHSQWNFLRPFASQTLLSRTDYQNHSTSELREELNKRGIVTRSKKKSILIDKLLELERGRTISASTHKTVQATIPPKNKVSGEKNPKNINRAASDLLDRSTITVSSPTKIVARLMSEPDGVVPSPTPIQTGPNSASLGSPLTTIKSAGHEAKTWPASINLPTTPVEEPLGTVIPFIPDNWTSHQQSHAPQLIDIQSSPADLQISTASHPSTLPEGGPSLIVTNKFSSNATSSSLTSEKSTESEIDLDKSFSTLLNSISNRSSMTSTTFNTSKNPANHLGRFEPEDRALNDRERTGLIQLIAFFGGSWILATFFDH